jgi:hydroxyethylthiazole kinase
MSKKNRNIYQGEHVMSINAQSIWSDVVKIREKSPLVHNITNYVVMNSTANALLALGASPVMAHAKEEVSDMVNIAKALVINIGTLSEKWIQSMYKAALHAKNAGVPIVLDPVGAGATPYRTETTKNLLVAVNPTIIRGNASEIMAIVQAEAKTKGVDSLASSESAIEAAKQLAKSHQCAVCISGETDYIVEDDQIIQVKNGHPMMPRVTGFGCTASALCGAFIAANPSASTASAHAMAVMGIAGELAAKQAKGPGSLQMHFLDALYNLTETDITERVKLELSS